VAGDADSKQEITTLLAALRRGDASAMERLMPLVYGDLHRRARHQLRRLPQATLSPTGLVHEAYLKLVGSSADWQDRNHFFAVASKAMRGVVVDYARRRSAKKRGGLARPVALDEAVLRVEENAAEILGIHEALERLATVDERLSDLVELRFFGGLSIDEAAGVLKVSDRTAKRDWTKARTLLFQMLHEAR